MLVVKCMHTLSIYFLLATYMYLLVGCIVCMLTVYVHYYDTYTTQSKSLNQALHMLKLTYVDS